jgi:hypothetical protein
MTREAESVMNDPVLMSLWQEVQQGVNRRESERAKADPLSHKNTRVFDAGVSASYRYYPAPKNGKGQKVWFCWSTHRNAAGFFLGWRETYRKNGTVKRDKWLSRRVKTRCKEIAKRRAGVPT